MSTQKKKTIFRGCNKNMRRLTEVERLAWANTPNCNRHVNDAGEPYVLELDRETGATVLTPLMIVGERMLRNGKFGGR